MPAGLRLVSCSDLYFIRQGTPSRFQKDKTGASHAETRGQGKQELSCERVRLVVKRSRHVRADEEAVNLDLGRRGTRHMQVTREKNLLYMEKGFQESSPLCRCPLLPTELCPDFPEEESSAASCAPEAQKLRGKETHGATHVDFVTAPREDAAGRSTAGITGDKLLAGENISRDFNHRTMKNSADEDRRQLLNCETDL
ncbi:uncharacterized protein [Anser cygnoides]|uniref:uncharacterized protein isoform X3 n=1 Tax=Anser cygnoides TaxID=8845 RepID=UPI00200922DF|nr:uncharacterized protein LOC125182429 isoform X5 [Anser cygnoides]